MPSPAARQSSSKPVPPDDLWQKLDAAVEEVRQYRPDKPEGSFTAIEYAKHASINPSTARARLRKLVEAGKAEKFGKGIYTFYVLVRE